MKGVFFGCWMFFLLTRVFASGSIAVSGYVDSLGRYSWHRGKTDSVFVDEAGMKWLKCCDDSIRWGAAMTIYRANIQAMMELGFDSSMVLRHLKLYDSNSVLFDRLSRIEKPEAFTRNWKKALNSSDWSFRARKSPGIGEGQKLSLKWYRNKGGIRNANGLALVKRKFFPHIFEAIRSKWSALCARISESAATHNSHRTSSYNVYLINAQGFLGQ